MNEFCSNKKVIQIDKLITIICTAIVPAIINLIATIIIIRLYGEVSQTIAATLVVVTSVISALLILIAQHWLPTLKYFRPFKKYEGRWLQIIPDFERPISIVDLKYDRRSDRYLLKGFTLILHIETGINFTAHKFIERDYHDGFYYITNHTTEYKNGLGKIGFIETNYDGLIRAEGYFFDAEGINNYSQKHNTIMIKCDKNFFFKINPTESTYLNLEKIHPRKIAEMSKEFVEKEISIFNKKINVTIDKKCYSKNICEHCSCGERMR